MTLYETEWCPDCIIVHEKLEALGVAYDQVIVSDFGFMRHEVFEVSGQRYVPVLVDGETILTEAGAILSHLDSHSSKP